MDFESWCKDNGFDAAALGEPQKKKLLAAWKADLAPAPEPPPRPAPEPPTRGLDETLAAARADEDRKRKITEIVATVIAESPAMIETAEALGRQAIQGKWTVDKFELEILRARRPNGPGIA